MLTLTLITPPAAEPVSYAEAQDHLRLSTTTDQSYVENLLVAGRIAAESYTRRAFITQTWRATLDAWPKDNTLFLPRAPIQSISSLTVNGDTVSSGAYSLIDNRVHITGAPSQPKQAFSGITLTFVAGYGATAASVPRPIRLAILTLAAYWYDNRASTRDTHLAPAAVSLLQPYRLISLT